LEAGRTIALIGHTGSGKTTLTSLVPRFYEVTSGRITLDGADVRDVKLTSLRRAIGVISQDPFLFSATVRENITFGAPGLDDAEVEQIARLAQAHEFVGELPQGYDTVMGERGARRAARDELGLPRHLRPRPTGAPIRGRSRGPRRNRCARGRVMTFLLGAESAQTRATSSGSVDRGWRVATLPSRVGTRARV